MAKLYFRYGAMGSSKTANAIMVQYNYAERGQNALLLKPRLDTRDGKAFVASRSGLKAACSYIEDLDRIDLSRYDCLIVDEAQFLTKEQVERLVSIVDDRNIPVICYGLRADFRGELFEGSKCLMAWSDAIEEIKTVCWCGRKATFNARLSGGRVVKSGEQILLGGNESYVALCRRHWKRGMLAPLEIREIDRDRDRYLPEGEVSVYLRADRYFVLFENGNSAAYCAVLRDEGGKYIIARLACRPDARGKGYEERLIRHLTQEGGLSGGPHTITSPFSPRTSAFFLACGFSRAGDELVFSCPDN